MRRTWQLVKPVVIVLAVGFLAIQAVPYGWRHSNPAVTQDAPWPSPEARRLARAACYDCHSNETDWPPYSYVAPMSWLVRRDVDNGRDELNFSTWDRDDNEAGDAVESVDDRSMPPSRYTALHADAKLSDAERRLLVEALTAMDEAEGGEDRSGRGGPGRR
jgi:hypothetical protein